MPFCAAPVVDRHGNLSAGFARRKGRGGECVREPEELQNPSAFLLASQCWADFGSGVAGILERSIGFGE